MTGAGWPYLDGVITNQKTLPYTYWMFKCESWISGGDSAAEWRYSRRYWTAEELEAYEKRYAANREQWIFKEDAAADKQRSRRREHQSLTGLYRYAAH